MKQLSFEFFNSFTCIGSDCPDTCCKGWSISIDSDTAKIYKNTEGEFGAQLKKKIEEKDGVVYFRLVDGQCPFLNSDKLCEIYRNIGPDKMCNTCRTYPRISWFHGDVLFQGLTLSCPEAARMILSHPTPIAFDFGEDQSSLTSSSNEDWQLFNTLIDGMITSVRIMQNRDFSIFTRMRLLVSFNDLLQQSIDSGSYDECRIILDAFSDSSQLAILSKEVLESQINLVSLFTFVLHFYKNIGSFSVSDYVRSYLDSLPKAMNFCRSLLSQPLADDFLDDVSVEPYEIRYEHYAVYYLTRYYMKAYTKDSTINRVIANFIYLFSLHRLFSFGLYHEKNELLTFEELIPVYTGISRFLEHNSLNPDTLYQLFSDSDMADSTFLFSLI